MGLRAFIVADYQRNARNAGCKQIRSFSPLLWKDLDFFPFPLRLYKFKWNSEACMLLKCTLSLVQDSKPTIHRFFLFNQGLCRNLTKLWNRIHWQFGLNWKKKLTYSTLTPHFAISPLLKHLSYNYWWYPLAMSPLKAFTILIVYSLLYWINNNKDQGLGLQKESVWIIPGTFLTWS